ncbi:hypothetical protein R7P80_29250 [Vibrio sp. 2092]|uniref:hypothetical protein n=1 Tax=Vibrio sp. A1-1 TaxID=2912250 RepID=UPI001F421C9E|nr:hypothetical protein [Vibrio sp. A1-1]MDW1568122.1 hypothetical protein [Vibrio sp. YT-15]MDW2156884.1 hypothetical protein [Vibrio sp. 2092]
MKLSFDLYCQFFAIVSRSNLPRVTEKFQSLLFSDMSNKAIKLNEANQRLTELINELQEREREYDKALEHSANYLGNDERIEQGRDARAQALLESVSSVKKEIASQTQVVKELAANY